MEDHGVLKILKALLLSLSVVFVLFPSAVLAYGDDTTHPALTQEIVKFYNSSYPASSISQADAELIIQGSIDEDVGARFFNHFYDPVNNSGLSLPVVGAWPSSKEWGTDTEFQRGWEQGRVSDYFSGSEDFSWDRSIYEYVWGDRKRGLRGLGQVLHLLEDATVPDHTRNDPHPPAFDWGSPYEGWTKRFVRTNIDVEGLEEEKPVILPTIEDYFDSIASYSNNNFFSRDTASYEAYSSPQVLFTKLEKVAGSVVSVAYSRDSQGALYPLAKVDVRFGSNDRRYFIEDDADLILSNYWRLLSRQAVLHGAGVLKLFRDEVEKERRTHVLKNKNTSFLAKVLNETNAFIFGTPQPAPASVNLAFVGPPAPQAILPALQIVAAPLRPAAQIVTALPAINLPDLPQIFIPPVVAPPVSSPIVPQAAPPPAIPVPSPVFAFVPGFGGGLPVASPPVAVPEQQSPSPSLPQSGSGGSSPEPMVVPESDTTPPDVHFSIAECSASLSPDSCLVLSNTLHLAWDSDAPDFDSFEFTEGGVASTTHATSTVVTLSPGETLFSIRSRDTAGNFSLPISIAVQYSSAPIVINEIGWSGTISSPGDEWIELFNPTGNAIDLANIVLFSETKLNPYIPLSGTIPTGGFYVIESGSDSALNDITADLVVPFGQIFDAGERFSLAYVLPGGNGTTTLDRTFLCTNWCGKGTKDDGKLLSVERYDSGVSGEDLANWDSNTDALRNGFGRDGAPIRGTPGRRNSITFSVNKNKDINGSLVLTKANSPYVVAKSQAVTPTGSLTIEPGVVVKFKNQNAGFVVSGTMSALGTEVLPIVFTSLLDDTFGGDTNGDGPSSAPAPRNWSGISFTDGTTGSVLDHTLLRYGGGGEVSGFANLYASGASFTLDNSISEYAGQHGLRLSNSDSTIVNSTFRFMNIPPIDPGPVTFQDGAFIGGGNLTLRNNQFIDNYIGLELLAPSGVIENNVFTRNSERTFRLSNSRGVHISGNTGSENGWNGITMRDTLVSGNSTTTFDNNPQFPYILTNGGSIPVSSALVLGPGAVMKMDSSFLDVSGRIETRGTEVEPVLFTSVEDDGDGNDAENDGPTTGVQPGASDHRSGVRIQSGGTSAFEYTEFRFLNRALTYAENSPIFIRSVAFNNNFVAVTASTPRYIDTVENVTYSGNVSDGHSLDQ